MTAHLRNYTSPVGSLTGEPRTPVTVGRPAWHEEALCAQVGGDAWFPEREGTADWPKAKAICRECPVQTECLTAALENEEPWGVWGGLTAPERRKLLAGKSLHGPTVACHHCGEKFIQSRQGRIYCDRQCQRRAERARQRDRAEAA